MPNYRYKARDLHGKSVAGEIDLPNEAEAARHFKKLGYVTIELHEAPAAWHTKAQNLGAVRVKAPDLNLFTRQLCILQRAGLPVLRSLEALEEQTEKTDFRHLITRVKVAVEGGSVLSEALAQFPKVFDDLYVSMVKAGEAGGTLEQALERLADLGEFDQQTRDKINQATRYPLLVVFTLMSSVIVMLTFVVPQFHNLFSRFGAALPLPTKILVAASNAMTQYWWALLIFFLVAWASFRYLVSIPAGKRLIDSISLKLPILGPLFLKIMMSRFTRTCAMLMRTGLPILETLRLSSKTVTNRYIRDSIDTIQISVNEGKGISEPMKVSKVFPPMVYHMVALGEETGHLDELLIRVSEYYDQQSDYVIKNLTTLIEPILLFCLGGMVLFIALAIFLPMWSLSSLFINR